MSMIEEVNAEVEAAAKIPVDKLTETYSEGCILITNNVLGILNGLIDAMTKALEFMDGLKSEVDNDYADLEDYPPLPELPQIDSEVPDMTLAVDCPLASCLGLDIPAVTFPTGLPVGADENTIAQYEDYVKKLGQFTKQATISVAKNAGAIASNALKDLQNAPQNLLNMAVDSVLQQVAELLQESALAEMDNMVNCLVNADPNFNRLEEIIRYRALRDRLQLDSNNQPSLDFLGNTAKDQIAASKAKFDAVKAEALKAQDMASNVKGLSKSNPFSKFI